MHAKKGCYEGHLTLTATDKNGNKFVYGTPNTLTHEASRIASHLLVGDNASNFAVTKMGFGTGATPPLRTDANLEEEVHRESINEILRPAEGQVEFVHVLDFLSSANGSLLTEAGLITENGTSLFARQVHVGVPKDQNFRLEYRWRVVFT